MAEKESKGHPVIVVAFLIALALSLFFSSFVLEKFKERPQQNSIVDEKGKSILQKIGEDSISNIPILNQMNISVQQKAPPAKTLSYDEMFLRDAYAINSTSNAAFFHTELLRVGFFKVRSEETNMVKDIFRADILVKNVEKAPHNFYISDGRVWYNWENFSTTDSNFSSISVEPGEERHAYVLFGTVPRSISGYVAITIGGTRAYSQLFNDLIVISASFNVSLPLLAKPRTVLG